MCANKRADRHQFHTAIFVGSDGAVTKCRSNDPAMCAERRLLAALSAQDHGRMVVVRVAVNRTGICIKSSQPCGACRDVLVNSGWALRSVIWSTDGGYESCSPNDVPENAYRAKNSGHVRSGVVCGLCM